jgi:hypothetical protein
MRQSSPGSGTRCGSASVPCWLEASESTSKQTPSVISWRSTCLPFQELAAISVTVSNGTQLDEGYVFHSLVQPSFQGRPP